MTNIKKQQEDIAKQTFWQSHIDAYRKTHVSRKTYCREQNIDYNCFHYWYHKQTTPAPVKVIPVTLKEAVPATSHSILGTLKLNTGASLLIHDASVLTFLLERLL